MNCVCALPGLSRVTRPMDSMISVNDARYPTVKACSANGQSKPSLAIPRASDDVHAVTVSGSHCRQVVQRIAAFLDVGVIDQIGQLQDMPGVVAADPDDPGVRFGVDDVADRIDDEPDFFLILSFVDSPEFTFGMCRIVFLSRSSTSPIASV